MTSRGILKSCRNVVTQKQRNSNRYKRELKENFRELKFRCYKDTRRTKYLSMFIYKENALYICMYSMIPSEEYINNYAPTETENS